MDSSYWLESASMALATLENALLGESTRIPTSSQKLAKRPAESRKHTRRAPSDAMSDIESYGAPVKRRRESINNGSRVAATGFGGVLKPSTKCRKITSVLSSHFARSLSMNSSSCDASSSLSAAASDGDASMHVDTANKGISFFMPSCSSSSSSSPYFSSASPLEPLKLCEATTLSAGDGMQGRELKHLFTGRSLKARGKTKAGFKEDERYIHEQKASDQLGYSMDLDNDDTPISSGIPGDDLYDSDEDAEAIGVFALLLQPLQHEMYPDNKGALQAAVQQWALRQSHENNDVRSPAMLLEELDQRITEFKHLLMLLLGQVKGSTKEQQLPLLQGERLHEFYKNGCKIASIGEWLHKRRFPFLSVVLPDLRQELPLLQSIIQISQIIEDMYRVLQWAPEFSTSLKDMSMQYEELVRAKKALYRDFLAQDGLAWKTIGLPVDSILLLRVRQWFASVTEQCMARIAHVYECHAKSASAYRKEELSADALNQCSYQVLRTAAQCAVLCGNCFPDLAPHIFFIVSECVLWTSNKFRYSAQAEQKHNFSGSFGATEPSKSKSSVLTNALCRGKQLDSRALRLVQACERTLKLLSYTRTAVTMESTPFDYPPLSNEHIVKSVSSALQTLSSALVEMSWTLAEILAAFRLDGRLDYPSGAAVLFVDLVVRFAKKIVYFGGASVAAKPEIQGHLRQMQKFLDTIDSTNGGSVAIYY
ncbi:hypothetical protein GGI25_000989 [Coemansia spiralis]|uniref:Uncharacterized protein n=2 Tax=Coemansia TaxID=4863 RepID=A0A9W8GAU3_9FUNG|nr:hypothetical protein EDC05_002007 [Coemansia umbellata]KAJ2623222.1 hypothetical protein GGI26_002637 [Coemansia sp. RSA 1358]KAJ2680100.1 hypothetical protein GGI25_000989 [Coemansia spiralis]